MISQLSVQKLQKRGTDLTVPRFFVFMLIVFLVNTLPLCAKKQSKSALAVRQAEAQMSDMPLPVGGVLMPAVARIDDVGHDKAKRLNATDSTTLAESVESKEGSVLTYRVTATRESLIQFYEAEMMRLGWNKLTQSSGDEEIFVFESPLKVAIIQMRPEKPKKGWKRNKKIFLTLHQAPKENQLYS